MTEKEIIHGCKKHKACAQKALVDSYAPGLFSLCKRYFINDADAYDTLQDALILIFKNIGKYKEIGAFKGWMNKITINVSLKKLKKRGKLNEVDINGSVIHLQTEPIGLSGMYMEEILEYIRQLPAPYRIVFNLYEIDGYSHREICEKIDIKESTSRTRLARAKKMLQQKIKSEKLIAQFK